jgi:hypothetical protein
MMLSAVTVEDGGAETELEGGARMYLEGYLSETPFIRRMKGSRARRNPNRLLVRRDDR